MMNSARKYLLFAFLLAMGLPALHAGDSKPVEAKDFQHLCVDSVPQNTALERGRMKFRLLGCRICHGTELRMPPGAGNMDLMHVSAVGQDVGGNLIGNFVRFGIPQAQDQMPAYRNITQSDVSDLAFYIHLARQNGRYGEFTQLPLQGDAADGKAFFTGAGRCTSCHSDNGDLAHIGKKTNALALRALFLRPSIMGAGTLNDAGRTAHARMLETYTAAQVQNLVEYLQSLQ